MDSELYDVINERILESSKTAKELAEEVGKPYPTLMRELNAADSSAKLGVELLLPLMKSCRSVMPLRFLASRMDCRVSALPDVSDDFVSLSQKLLATYPILAEYHQAILDEQSLERVAELREKVIQQAQADFVAYARNKGEQGKE